MTARQRFPRYEIPGLQTCPDWWAVRPGQLEGIRASLRKGEPREIAATPYGQSVWAAAYGFSAPARGAGTWAIASNSHNVEAYRPARDHQTVLIACGIHGAEPEAVAGAANLLSLLETGRDLRGQRRDALVDLAGRYRLVIVPCVNMDGRLISPDTLRGASQDQFVRASQGVWADGSPVGYPDCKQYAPLPLEKVAHPGGYPNGDGYNIQHDACPADLRSAEAAGLIRLAAEEQADVVLNMHSHSTGGVILGASLLAYPLHVTRVLSYQQLVHQSLADAGLRPMTPHPPHSRGGLSINNALCMACGALVMTFEQSATADWSFEESLDVYFTTIETVLRRGLDEPFSPRRAVARGETDS